VLRYHYTNACPDECLEDEAKDEKVSRDEQRHFGLEPGLLSLREILESVVEVTNLFYVASDAFFRFLINRHR